MRCLVPVCLVALAACNGHRYGFFGDEDGESEGSGASTTGADTTQAPTTAPPVTTIPDPTSSPTSSDPTSSPTSSDPTSSDPTSSDPTSSPTITDPTIPDPTIPDPTTTGPSTLSDSGDPSTVTSVGTTDTTGGSQLCNEIVLDSLVPQSVFAGNFGNPDLFQPSCDAPGAGEVVFVWQAPVAGVFQFDTFGSTFNTILAVLGDFCGGAELACNDDFDGLTSALGVELVAGQFVTVVVEGFKGAEGNVLLNITQVDVPPVPCDTVDLGSVIGGGGAAGSTATLDDLRFGTCGGAGAPEMGFRWQAPHAGTFRFRAIGTDFDPVLYIRDDECNGPELACNNDFDGLNSQIDLALTPADGPIFLYLDAIGTQGGLFELKITEI